MEPKTLSIADLEKGATYHFRYSTDGRSLDYVVGEFRRREYERGENWVEIVDRITGKMRQLLARYIRYIENDVEMF